MTIPLDPSDPVIAKWLLADEARRRREAGQASEREARLEALRQAHEARMAAGIAKRKLAAQRRTRERIASAKIMRAKLRAEREARAAVARRCRERLRASAARRREA